MTGLRMTTMKLKEMRAARERGESKTDLALFQQNKFAGIKNPPAAAKFTPLFLPILRTP